MLTGNMEQDRVQYLQMVTVTALATVQGGPLAGFFAWLGMGVNEMFQQAKYQKEHPFISEYPDLLAQNNIKYTINDFRFDLSVIANCLNNEIDKADMLKDIHEAGLPMMLLYWNPEAIPAILLDYRTTHRNSVPPLGVTWTYQYLVSANMADKVYNFGRKTLMLPPVPMEEENMIRFEILSGINNFAIDSGGTVVPNNTDKQQINALSGITNFCVRNNLNAYNSEKYRIFAYVFSRLPSLKKYYDPARSITSVVEPRVVIPVGFSNIYYTPETKTTVNPVTGTPVTTIVTDKISVFDPNTGGITFRKVNVNGGSNDLANAIINQKPVSPSLFVDLPVIDTGAIAPTSPVTIPDSQKVNVNTPPSSVISNPTQTSGGGGGSTSTPAKTTNSPVGKFLAALAGIGGVLLLFI